jgi:hypothetical protein
LAITQAWEDFASFVLILFRVNFKIGARWIVSEEQLRNGIEQSTLFGFELLTLFENLFAHPRHAESKAESTTRILGRNVIRRNQAIHRTPVRAVVGQIDISDNCSGLSPKRHQ